ncbi:MAG: acyl-CoA dehydrogenase family protein [Mycobacterium sp.]
MFTPDEVIDLRTRARSAVQRCIAPFAREIGSREESRDSFPWQAFRGLGDEGLLAVPYDSEFGAGLQHPMLATAAVTEEIAYQSSSMGGIYDAHCILVPATLGFASEAIRAQLIPSLVSGKTTMAFATSEPEASSDLTPSRLQTALTETDGGYLVSGRKRWITNSVVAPYGAILCRDGDASTMLLVALTGNNGVTVGEPDLKMGHRGQLTADIVFENAFVPTDNILGERGKGLAVALAALTRGRIGVAAVGVGVAQAALDLAVHRLRHRSTFGAPLGSRQHWQMVMAQHATELECARSLYMKAAIRLDRGQGGEPEGPMAKVLATRLAVNLTRDAIQVHGGYGFAREIAATGETFRLEELYRDAKILEIFEGANELQQWIIARKLIGRDITN